MEINRNIIYLTKLEIILKYKKISESKYARTATIYNYNDKELLKVFKNNKNFDKDKYQIYCDLDLPNFATPKKLVYILGRLYGYIMDKKPGNMLDVIDTSINIREFFTNISKVEENIYTLSYHNLVLADLHEQNILYDEKHNEINIIDMDDYFFNSLLSSRNEVFYINSKLFYRSLLNILISRYDNLELDIFNKNYRILIEIINNELDRENFNGEYIFSTLISEIENRCDENIITLQDFRECSKKMLKK